MWTCFIDDPVGVRIRDLVGIDKMMWELDYPHSDSTWPQAPEMLFKSFDGVSDEDINKITHLNAMKCYDFDPFSIRSREECTVGALRAEAADVDIEIKSMGRRKSDADGAAQSLRLATVAAGAAKS